MLDIVTTTSASVHALTCSSRPGAVPPASITTPLASMLAGAHAGASTSAHPDAEMIDLAERVKALADRHDRVLCRALRIHGRIDHWHFANRPVRPEELPSEMTLVRTRTDTHEVTHTEQPLRALAERKAQRDAYEAAEAAHERAVERKRARTREPYLDKLQLRIWRRLERWVRELSQTEPQTQAGMAAKAAASVVIDKAADGMEWAGELSKGVSADALRIICAEADAWAEQDRQADGELLALGRAWELSCTRYERACAAEEVLLDAHDLVAPPKALFARLGDVEALAICPSRDGVDNPLELPWYGLFDTIGALRRMAQGGSENPRRDEIIGAYDRWRADIVAEKERSGLAAAEAERQASASENAILRARICMMPSRSQCGVDLKLRVVLWLHDGIDSFVREMGPENVEDPQFSASLALSMALDLARMGRGAAPVSLPRAADRSAA